MKFLSLLFILSSCASYTDPEGERLSYYNCERSQVVAVKHSEDYQSIRIKLGGEQVLLHYFVMEEGEGYSNEQYLWVTKGKKAKLVNKKRDGTEIMLLNDCKLEKKS